MQRRVAAGLRAHPRDFPDQRRGIFAAALKGPQMLGHRPALILGAEPVRLRDADVVEVDLVLLMVAGEGADWLAADARRGHVAQRATDRKRVGLGMSVFVRVGIGRRSILTYNMIYYDRSTVL